MPLNVTIFAQTIVLYVKDLKTAIASKLKKYYPEAKDARAQLSRLLKNAQVSALPTRGDASLPRSSVLLLMI